MLNENETPIDDNVEEVYDDTHVSNKELVQIGDPQINVMWLLIVTKIK